MFYCSYRVKTGSLSSTTGGFEYFTSADIGWNWLWLNEGLEEVAVDESELPKLADGSIPISETENKPTVVEK